MAADILIVDDESDIRELIGGILADEGFEPRLAHDSDSAIAAVSARRPALVILDIWLQGSRLDGLEVLAELKTMHADLPVVIISGHGNIETAVSAIKQGAYDYIEKPFKADRLVLVVNRALETSRLRKENEDLRGRSVHDGEMIGNSIAMRQLRQTLAKVAQSNGRVMIRGPLGSGKELAARTLHALSKRADAPFVILPAATMTPERMEEELFGIEAAGEDGLRKVGALEQAHGGTLYIDEVADMPLETQGKVLRVLVDQKFQRVGGAGQVEVDVRIVASSARNLAELIAQGAFREDLFHRLSVVPIDIPPLRERREDIPDLIDHFCRAYSLQSGQPVRRFADDAIALMQTQDWPGNVRQLRNNVERVLILAGHGEEGGEIGADRLPGDIGADAPGDDDGASLERMMALPLREAREAFEREYLTTQLARFGGNISRTSQFVGIERSALHRKLKVLGMVAEAPPAGDEAAAHRAAG